MTEVKVKAVCNLDNITQDASWGIISNMIDTYPKEEELLLDFTGINVAKPWGLIKFGKILERPNVKLRFVSRNKDELESFINKIKMKCIIEGLSTDKVEGIYVEPAKVKSKYELKIEGLSATLIDDFEEDEELGAYVIKIYKRYEQIYCAETIDAIVHAMIQLNKLHGISKFVLDTNKILISDTILVKLSNLMLSLEKDYNIDFKVISKSKDIYNRLNLYIFTSVNKSYNTKERILEFSKLKHNTAGLLSRYKKSKAIDSFGREGKGQVVSCRIALYRGLCKQGSFGTYSVIEDIEDVTDTDVITVSGEMIPIETVGIVIDTYHTDKFCTKAEIICEHDGQLIDDDGMEIRVLPCDRSVISADNIGLHEKFLGSQYHFSEPIQSDTKDNKLIITEMDENKNAVMKEVTLPERIMTVLNDWGMPVDVLSLQKCILKTQDILSGKEEENKQ